MKASEFGVYVHIPFCISKCIYCDFLSFPINLFAQSDIQLYFNTLNKEIKEKSEITKAREVTSVYIGGGTPSSVPPEYIFNLLNELRKHYTIKYNAEITIEINPGTVQIADLLIYKQAGINRISFGVQSTNDNILKFLKRIHSKEDFLKSVDYAQKTGINNINADLIFGIPNQSLYDFKNSLNEVTNLGIPHLSAYSLIIEPGTRLYSLIENNTLEEIPESYDRDMYHYCIDFLRRKGYFHYEISNFAIKDNICSHNMLYWNCKEYDGLGLGASSYINGVRYKNTEDFSNYIKDGYLNKHDTEYLSRVDKMNEYMMLGFRLTNGPDPAEFYERFGNVYHDIFNDKLNLLENKGLITRTEYNNKMYKYKLSKTGLDIANQVFLEFI